MFAIHTPTTVTLTEPGADGPFTTINFHVNGADTSRCIMEIVTPAGDTHRITFGVRGALIDQQFVNHDSAPEDPEAQPLTAQDYMVDGRDMRAFNPYTYDPPVDADTAARAAQAPNVRRDEPRDAAELRRAAHADAAERAKDARAELLSRQEERPEQRAEREKKEREDRLARVEDNLGGTATPGDDHATVRTFPDQGTQDSVAGKRMDGSPQTNPDNAPMAPAASSPLPGSPPPHPLDQSDPGKVNTTSTLQPAQ